MLARMAERDPIGRSNLIGNTYAGSQTILQTFSGKGVVRRGGGRKGHLGYVVIDRFYLSMESVLICAGIQILLRPALQIVEIRNVLLSISLCVCVSLPSPPIF